MREGYSQLLTKIRTALEEKRDVLYEHLSLKPLKWSPLRTLLEFVAWCLSDTECRDEFTRILTEHKKDFINAVRPDVVAVALLVQGISIHEEHYEKTPEENSRSIQNRRQKVTNKIPI